jgi:hypothetical protein
MRNDSAWFGVRPDPRLAEEFYLGQSGPFPYVDSVPQYTPHKVGLRGSERITYKLTPKHPLSPGEYGLMTLPKGQNAFGIVIYDFAIDATATENAGALAADQDSSPRAHR